MAAGNVETKAFPELFRAYSQLRTVNRLAPSDIVDIFGEEIKFKLTSSEGVPVLVCARNEEEDLPRLLLALSTSLAPVRPVVVNNSSTDKTAEVAAILGATVVDEPSRGLCNALARGFEYMANSGIGKFLLTDADAFPNRFWAETMHQRLGASNQAVEVFGPLYFYGSAFKDTLRSSITLALDLKQSLTGRARAHGPNAAVSLTSEMAGKVINTLRECGAAKGSISDQVIRDAILEMGGTSGFCWSPTALVFSRGDRYPTIRSIFKAAISPNYKREVIYKGWEPAISH